LLSVVGVQVPPQILSSIPYVITIVVVAGVVGRVRGPAAAGQPYEQG
jgi:general nucleoside transport system permease protein